MTTRRLGLALAALALLAMLRVLPPVAFAAEPAATFDGAAALRHLERLVALGPRPAGSPAAERSRAYIVGELKRLGLRTEVRAFEAVTPEGPVKMANIVATLPGPRSETIMIAGHYDTKVFREFRFVGANDGGSSAALLLELARALAPQPRRFTYSLVWFDGEEARVSWTERDSLYGSRRLAEELVRARRLPKAMVLVDMIGDRDLGIRRETYSIPWLTDIIWSSAARLGHARHFLADSMPVEDDHVPFLKLGVPATLLIDFDYPPWHTADDTLDKVSAASLAVVGRVLLDALPAIELYLSR